MPIKTLIMGAAGRDFHNFNTYFRGNSDYQVVAFTATQIPDIEGRLYPPELAGSLYPAGIPIHAEEELPALIRDLGVEQVVFSYSDVPHEYVMHKASQITALGADFRLMGTRHTQVKSTSGVRLRRGRLRQEPNHPPGVAHPARAGLQSRRHPPPDALR
jgi:predicted GTPase